MSIILENIFSTEFVYMWIRVVTPILLPALGGAICNRAGVVNLGLEGIMLISALAGVLGGAYGGSLLTGLLAGLGCAELKVFRRPTAALISTGDELVERTQIPAKRVLSALTILQVRGYAQETPGHKFAATVLIRPD